MKEIVDNRIKFNIFSFVSTFARSLVEIFVSLYLFKNGFSINLILVFYLLENFFSLFIAYGFIRIGEKYKYSVVMYIGIISFAILQVALTNVVNNYLYIVFIAFLYSMYRRGYWVARRFYIINVIPQKDSSESFSILVILSQIASVLSGYVGSIVLDNLSMIVITLISSVLLFISVIPLLEIKYETDNKKIELIKNLKKYDKRNFIAFSLYEINNLLVFLFPIYIAIYIKDTYIMAGSLNAISNIAIIIFVFVYGKVIKKRNYFILSSVLLIAVCLIKVFVLNYFILIVYFFEGLVKQMQNQSVNKIFFENRHGMDSTHYNLIYQLIDSFIRFIVALPLLFMTNVRIMILFVIIVVGILLVIYSFVDKNKVLS